MTIDQSDYIELNRGEGGDKVATKTSGALKVQKFQPIFMGSSDLVESGVAENTRFPVEDIKYLDFSGTLPKDENGAYTIVNEHGFSSIGFHLTIPTSGTIIFEGSFDGSNWTPITFRQIGADGFLYHAHADEDFVGSVATLRYIRFRTEVAGSVDGAVSGRLTHQVHTLEGIEHGNPPHNIGVHVLRFGVDVTGAVSDQILYTPTSSPHNRKVIITGYVLSVHGTGTVKIFDETDEPDNWLVAVKVRNETSSTVVSHEFSPPFVTAAAGHKIKITATETAVVMGVVTGYEVCS